MDDKLKISHSQGPTPSRYAELEEQIKPFAKDTAFRWSRNSVPHLLVELGRGVVYSVCYFKRQGFWRVFYPYGYVSTQEKQDFYSVEEILKFLRRHKPRGAC